MVMVVIQSSDACAVAGSSAKGGWRFITISYSPHSHPHPSLITPVALQHKQINKRIGWLVVSDRVNGAQCLGVQREEDGVFDDFLYTKYLPHSLTQPLFVFLYRISLCVTNTRTAVYVDGTQWVGVQREDGFFYDIPISTPVCFCVNSNKQANGLLLLMLMLTMMINDAQWLGVQGENCCAFNDFLYTSRVPLPTPICLRNAFHSAAQNKQTKNALLVGCW